MNWQSSQNESFLSTEYIVRKDLLVAPILTEQESRRGWRSVYLPGPDHWFRFNLSCEDPESKTDEGFFGYALQAIIPGGCRLRAEGRIQPNVTDFSKITPMYIREGNTSKIICQGTDAIRRDNSYAEATRSCARSYEVRGTGKSNHSSLLPWKNKCDSSIGKVPNVSSTLTWNSYSLITCTLMTVSLAKARRSPVSCTWTREQLTRTAFWLRTRRLKVVIAKSIFPRYESAHK